MKAMVLGLALAVVMTASAEVSVGFTLRDHAVVQRGSSTLIWGKAKAGEKIGVTLASATGKGVADANGEWGVRIDTSKLGEGPFELKVKGESGEWVSKDVLVGEVWLAGGQSNMEFQMDDNPYGKIIGYEERVAAIKERPLRFFSLYSPSNGNWRVVTPQVVGKLSAVAYCFIDTLQRRIGGAAGVVSIPKSGSTCAAWLPKEAAVEMPWLKKFENEKRDIHRFSALWNNKFLPVAKTTFRGVIWYQGCSDSGSRRHSLEEYPLEFTRMVKEIRKTNGADGLPFLYCQISGWGREDNEPSQGAPGRALVREAQRRMQETLPNSGMAVILDNSEVEIHNRMKGPAGDRLAYLALNRVYGKKDVVCKSPDYSHAVAAKDGSVIVTFRTEGCALKAGPFRTELSWNVHSNTTIKIARKTAKESELEGFALCGTDGKWVWANAKIVGKDKVKVWAKGVTVPRGLRYNFGGQGFGNLVNEAGLPASPFMAESIALEGAEYPVMCWTYYPFEKMQEADFVVESWVKLGINRPMTPVVTGDTDKGKFRSFLDKCAAAGLRVYVYDKRIGESGVEQFIKDGDEQAYRRRCREVNADWGSHPAVAGFYVYDEPDGHVRDRVFKAAKMQMEEMPDKEPSLNLLPWFSWIGKRIGSNSLSEYLDYTSVESGLGYLGYDCYTQQYYTDEGLGDYFDNLLWWSEFENRSGKRWNTTLLCAPHYRYQIRSDADFRWQISTAAAFGADGISWFYPDHHHGYIVNFHQVPINPFGERTQVFEWMSEEIRLFQHQYGAIFPFLKLESAAIAGKTFGHVPRFGGDRQFKSLDIADGKEFSALVSMFHDSEGTRYAAIVNLGQDAADSREFKFTFKDGVKPMLKGWDDWSELRPSKDAGLVNATGETGETRSLWMFLSPGQIALVKLVE